MAVLSRFFCLRTAVKYKFGPNILRKPILVNRSVISQLIISGQRRCMSDKRIFTVKPSKFFLKKFMDALHFYTLLGVIPLSILVFFVNVFIGPAQLADIPEGYEPKPWEYSQHPIERFFARYVYPSHQQDYEKMLHFLNEKDAERQLIKLQRKVRDLQRERHDYKAYYYHPAPAYILREVMEKEDDMEERESAFIPRLS